MLKSKKKEETGKKELHCQFNCRTGRVWYFLGYRQSAGYKVPKEIIEEYYQDELRRINDRNKIVGVHIDER